MRFLHLLISILPISHSIIGQETVGIRTTTPAYTLDIVHANGTPMAGDSNGLNIRHEGENNENWTLYVSNTDGDLEFYHQGVKEVEFTGDGMINILSDERAKKNIVDLENALAQLLQLAPKTYTYKHSRSNKIAYGFLAQDVEKIFPDFVDHNQNDDLGERTYTLNYFSFIPVLVKSLQEQQAMIEAQQQKIQMLEIQYQLIVEKLDRMEAAITKENR